MKTKLLLLSLMLSVKIAYPQSKIFSIDFNTDAGRIKKLGSVNLGPKSVIAGTAERCYQDIGVEMIRTHDYHGPCDYYGYTNFFDYFLQKFNYSFQSHLGSDYKWASTDNQINTIVNGGFTPFFRLGISFPGNGVSPASPMPKDSDGVNFRTFAGICKRTAMHYTDGWNNGFKYSIPYWEIWNEPNNNASWNLDSVQAYYRMYKQASDSLKSFNSSLKVGGAATARNAFYSGGNYFTLNHDYISSFFQFCKDHQAPLDFYSFHTYDRKNPYHLKLLADTLSYFLNQYGFTNTELIVSEMNMDSKNVLGYQNSSKGCAYATSSLISAQDSRITKIFWYRGVDLGALCNADSGQTPNLTPNAYAYKFFNELSDSTAIQLTSIGNEVVKNDINNSSSNLMLLAGKDSVEQLIKILISNLASAYTEINLNLKNLPWASSDLVNVFIEKITSTGYDTSSYSIPASGLMNFQLSNVTPESVYLITLRKNVVTSAGMDGGNVAFGIFPNPAHTSVSVKTNFSDYKIVLYNAQAQLIFEGRKTREIEVLHYPAGVYFLIITANDGRRETAKLILR